MRILNLNELTVSHLGSVLKKGGGETKCGLTFILKILIANSTYLVNINFSGSKLLSRNTEANCLETSIQLIRSLKNDIRRNKCSWSIQKEDCKKNLWSNTRRKQGFRTRYRIYYKEQTL